MAFGAPRRVVILVVLMLSVSMTGFATIARAQTPLESARSAVEDTSASLERLTARVTETQGRADAATAAFWEQLNEADRAAGEAERLVGESDELGERIDGLREEVSDLMVERYMGAEDDDGPLVFSDDLNAGVRADALASFASANRFDAMAEFEGLIEDRDRVLVELQEKRDASEAASESAADARRTIDAELATLAKEQDDLTMRLADLRFSIERLEEEERQQVLAEEERQRVEEARRAAEAAAAAAAELARNQPPTATPAPPTPTPVPTATAIPVIEPTVVPAPVVATATDQADAVSPPSPTVVPPTGDAADLFDALDVDETVTQDEAPTPTSVVVTPVDADPVDTSDPAEASPTATAEPAVAAPVVEEPTATPAPTATPTPEPTPEPTATPEPVVTGTMAAGWTCPVRGPFTHIDDWGAPRVSGGWHKGNDMIADEGLPVVAVIGGTVEHRGNSVGGNSAHLKGDDGNYYYYTHLLGYENEGIGRVEAGTVIGYVGETGNAPIPHLHFEVHIGGYGNYTNPYPILREYC